MKSFVYGRLSLYASSLPVFAEIGLVCFLILVGNAVLYRHQRIKHSALLFDQGPFSVGVHREKPREHHATKFFQNQHGLWIHYFVWRNESLPVEEVKGIVVMLHGHSEHINRHEHNAEFLRDSGFLVFGIDHQGFGRSEGDRCHVEQFHHYIDDIMLFFQDVLKENYSDLVDRPKFIVAHSMGGVIGVLTALRFQKICEKAEDAATKQLFTLNGVVIGSPALYMAPITRNKVVLSFLRVLAFLFPKSQIFDFPSSPTTIFLQTKLHSRMDPLNYNDKLRPHQLLEMIDAAALAVKRRKEFKTPIFLFHGTKDTTTDIEGSRLFFSGISTPKGSKEFHELEGVMHEPMQDPWETRKPLMEKMRDWLLNRASTEQ